MTVQSSPLFLCFSVLNFKTLFFQLQIGMRFTGLHHESNITYYVVQIHQWWKLWLLHSIIKWKSICYFAGSLNIPLSTNEGDLTHTWIMIMMRFKLRTFWLLEGNITAIWCEHWPLKWLSFCLKIKGSDFKSQHYHRKKFTWRCEKSVQIRIFFWSVISCI